MDTPPDHRIRLYLVKFPIAMSKSVFLSQLLEALVLGTSSIRWDGPVDDLVRIQDVTGFAVDAVGMIDL